VYEVRTRRSVERACLGVDSVVQRRDIRPLSHHYYLPPTLSFCSVLRTPYPLVINYAVVGVPEHLCSFSLVCFPPTVLSLVSAWCLSVIDKGLRSGSLRTGLKERTEKAIGKRTLTADKVSSSSYASFQVNLLADGGKRTSSLVTTFESSRPHLHSCVDSNGRLSMVTAEK
jgi:hypothetical protein